MPNASFSKELDEIHAPNEQPLNRKQTDDRADTGALSENDQVNDFRVICDGMDVFLVFLMPQ